MNFAKTTLLGAALTLGLAATSTAAVTATYGWETGDTGYFDSYGNIVVQGIVTGSTAATDGNNAITVPAASEGSKYFHVTESPIGGTPNATVAYVTGIAAGDKIDVSIDGIDFLSADKHRFRIWFCEVKADGTYNGGASSASFDDSKGYSAGSDDPGNGWVTFTNGITVDAGDLANGETAGIGIQVRLYSDSANTEDHVDFFFDNLQISVNNDSAVINTPAAAIPEPASLALLGLGGLAMLRRRK